MENEKRIFDILELYNSKYSELEDAFAYRNRRSETNDWIKVSAKEYYEQSHLLACALTQRGYQKGDKILTLSPSLPHWNIVDMAMSMIGVIHIPIYTTIALEEMDKILHHCDAKAIFIANKDLYLKVKHIIDSVPTLEHVYSFYEIEEIESLQTLIDNVKVNVEPLMNKVQAIKNEIQEDDVHTIIYTSGTTGEPKGVMITHKNLLCNARPLLVPLPNRYKDHCLSFLPLCHIYERMLNYAFQWLGSGIYYAENLGTIQRDIASSKPVIFNSVPLVLEKFYDGIVAKGKDLKGIKKMIFFWSLRLGTRFNERGNNSAWYNAKLRVAQKLVFSQLQQAFGGNIKVIVSGGSSLQPRLAKLYSAIGFGICEGYGLSETSPVISVNLPNWEDKKLGTIGPVLKGVEVKIAEDGEILTRGNCVMKGYYKAPELTAQVIDEDGWFHTGDIGTFEDNHFLKITDRKKEIFKTAGGKYIAPQVIENKFKSSNFVVQIMVVGENEKFASALISPNFNYLHFWAAKHKVHFKDNEELIANPNVIKRIQREINEVNKSLTEHEKIKKFRLVTEEWTQPSGELSQTLKLRRNFIRNKYKKLLVEMYGHGENEDHLAKIDETSIKEKIKAVVKETKQALEESRTETKD